MNSTSISKKILEVKDLTISFNFSRYQSKSLKDLSLDFIKSPVRFFFNRPKRIEILKKISFDLRNGERLGFLGINGVGKTTLCRTISGMYGDKDGIIVNGTTRAIFDTESVIQPELSGKENAWIITNIIYSHLSKVERAEIVEESLEFSELHQYINSPFKIYSKGMKVRLFLSIVSAKPCDLLILDEVFNGGDEFFNEKVSSRIKKVIEGSGAVLFISHDKETVRSICNRVIVLGEHRILFDGDVNEGIDFYVDKFSE